MMLDKIVEMRLACVRNIPRALVVGGEVDENIFPISRLGLVGRGRALFLSRHNTRILGDSWTSALRAATFLHA